MEQKTTSLKQNEKMTRIFSGRHSLTILLLVIAGFMVFWFMLSGSLSDNRFGTHIVMSSDLTSLPAWYGLSLFFISAGLTIGGFILFFLLYRELINLTESQEKVIRVGSLFMMGTASFYIALSSITFAAFNNEFFISAFSNRFVWDSLAPILTPFGNFKSETSYSLQGVVIASMSLITFAIIMSVTSFLFFSKTKVSNKFYYSGRNSAVLLIALGWLTFNINVVAFGSMGGDASILINAVLGTNIDFNTIGEKAQILNEFSLMNSRASWKAIKPFLEFLSFLQFNALHAAWSTIWNSGWQSIPPLSDLLYVISTNIILISPWLADMSKESFFQGVNESMASYILFGTFIIASLASPFYIVLTYFTFKDNKISIFYDWSIYTLLGVTVIYGILAWTIPYISFANIEDYNPIIDGFIHGEANGLAPGLIGQTGQPGGINGALVYFSPNYHGTITWWIGFGLVLIIPFVTAGLAIFKNYKTIKDNFDYPVKKYLHKTTS